MLRRCLLGLLAAPFFFSYLAARPGICLKSGKAVEKEDPFAYAQALIDSFGWAQSALSRTPAAANAKTADGSPSSTVADIAESMFALRLAIKDFECAASQIQDYQSSKNEKIQMSAKGAHLVYSLLVDHDNAAIAEMERLVDVRSIDLAKEIRRLTDLRVKVDEAWKMLPVATAALLHALLDLPRDPKQKLGRLVITTAQRKELTSALHEKFGDEIKKGMKAGQIPLVASAAMAYGFVADERWKSSDSK